MAILSCGLCGCFRAVSTFDRVTHAVQSRTGARRQHLFGLGYLANKFVSATDTAGTSEIRFAVFETAKVRHFNSTEFGNAVAAAMDSPWQIMIRTRSTKDQEQTIVYYRPSLQYIDLLVATAKFGEAT